MPRVGRGRRLERAAAPHSDPIGPGIGPGNYFVSHGSPLAVIRTDPVPAHGRRGVILPHDPAQIPHMDLQPLTKQMDLPFWERATCGQVLEADSHQLTESSCQFLFDALTEHKHLWRNQLTQVVDKKTRRIQWILQQEADSLYYEAIPSSPGSAASRALVELD